MSQSSREDAIAAWVEAKTRLLFIWGNQNAPVPDGDFVKGEVLATATPGLLPQETTVMQIRTHEEFSVALTIYSASYLDSYDLLRYARTRTELETGSLVLVSLPKAMQPIPFITGKSWEPAGVATLRFRYLNTIDIEEGTEEYIAIVELEGTVDDIDVAVSVVSELQN